jgi:hypothetical protein
MNTRYLHEDTGIYTRERPYEFSPSQYQTNPLDEEESALKFVVKQIMHPTSFETM